MQAREQFSASIDSDVLLRMRDIAMQEDRDFDELVEHALRIFANSRPGHGVREEVMAHFWNSVEKNRELLERFADSESRKCTPGGSQDS